MSLQYLCIKKPLKMVNDRKNTTVPVFNGMFERSTVTSQLNYATIKVSSDSKKIHGKKQNNFVISLFIFIK